MSRIISTLRSLAVVGFVAVGLVGSSAMTANAAPRPDMPKGATVSLSATTVAPGGSVSFTGTGWTTEASVSTGAIVGAVKLDDVDQLNSEGFVANAAGQVSGRVTIPSTVAPGEHWLRFLSGSDQEGDPTRSIHAMITVAAAPAPKPSTTAKASSTPKATAGTSNADGDDSDDEPTSAPLAAGTTTTGSTSLPKTGLNATGVLTAAAALGVVALSFGVVARHRRRQTEQSS